MVVAEHDALRSSQRKRLVNRAHDRVGEIIPLTLGNESTYLVGDEVFRPARRLAG